MHIKKRIKRMAAFVVFLGILFTLMPCKLTSASASGVPGQHCHLISMELIMMVTITLQ